MKQNYPASIEKYFRRIKDQGSFEVVYGIGLLKYGKVCDFPVSFIELYDKRPVIRFFKKFLRDHLIGPSGNDDIVIFNDDVVKVNKIIGKIDVFCPALI